jgi:glutathionylspermidine synthase
LIERRRLAVVNAPPTAALESKAVLAAIWGLIHTCDYFSGAERKIVTNHFIPTSLDPPPDCHHVVKPFFGSNGDSIKVVDASGGIVESNRNSTYADQPMVYQDYVAFPCARMLTGDGVLDLRMVWSCFIVNGQPFGITLRVGTGVTDGNRTSVGRGVLNNRRSQTS